MRPIVKPEPGIGGVLELPQQQQETAAAATGESSDQHRRAGEERGAEWEVRVQGGCAEARALGLLGLERERSIGEQLRQAAVKMAELRAGIGSKEAAKADDALLEFKFQSKEAVMQRAEQGRVDRGKSSDHQCERRSETPQAERFTAPR
jgi:hypothetical protein